MTLELIVDGVIILMVAILIGFAIKLNFRLKTFRGAQQEMAAMVGQLNDIVAKAQQSIFALKQASGDEEGRLKELVGKARAMADELSLINDTGANLADRIERGLIPDERRDEEAEGFKGADERAFEEGPEKAEEEESEMMKTLRKVR